MLAKPIMVRVAFYRGKGTLRDRLVRLLTRSRYSRVEILVGHRLATGWHAYALRGTGVRPRLLLNVEAAPDDWDLLELPGFTKSGVERWYKCNGEMPTSLLQDLGAWRSASRLGTATAAGYALDLPGDRGYTVASLYRELVDHWAL